MSRLTASPFHKPAPFLFPREPISPPETLTESLGMPQIIHELRQEENTPPSSESPLHSRTRRPSISYQNSGLRETSSRPVHRSYRFFVVVVPPSGLLQEHGQLGHTLTSGPPHRLAQGIIMPLLPTMYGQLAAIAKEFNFPSTTGLCLYLHFNENGIVITPRISEESWHMLWSHLFDMPSTPRGPPIGGKIEFDIDLHQARWYSSWISTLARDQIERPLLHIPSNAPSLTHVRGGSRNSITEDGIPEPDQHITHLSQPYSIPNTTRHVPKKLSLVDRFDYSSTPPESKTGIALDLGVPDQGPSKTLSPIAQEEEPQSAREELDSRVKSWRASAVIKPTSLAGRGQTSLEPVNLPNNLLLDEDITSNVDEELNLEDFTWSISSVGPDDYDIMSLETLSDRLPSPDMARRMFEDSPPTPSTATSWGPPLSYPCSPLSDYRPPSLDLGFRSMFSRPLTPATATSWGPMSPASSCQRHSDVSRPASVHLGDRAEFSRPVTPSTATSWGAPLSYPPTPTTPFHVATPDVAQRSFDYAQEHEIMISQGHPWSFVWPYLQSPEVQPWRLVWPYFQSPEVQPWQLAWPYFQSSEVQPWQLVWPYFHSPEAQPWQFVWPYFHSFEKRPWQLVWPYFQSRNTDVKSKEEIAQPMSLCGASGYPHLLIYPAVYPHFDLYPASPIPPRQDRGSAISTITVTLDAQYPTLHIYDATYPHNLSVIYPPVPTNKEGCDTVFVTATQYPSFNIYPAVYPCFDLYPTVRCPTLAKVNMSQNISHAAYPNLVIYPPVYPHLDIYPAKKAAENLEKNSSIKGDQLTIYLPAQYPNLNIYPAVYPHFDIYPSCTSTARGERVPVLSMSRYPFFDLYLAVYPHFNIYPSCLLPEQISVKELSTVITTPQYPVFDLYPAVYPHLTIYPPISGENEHKVRDGKISTTLRVYPYPVIRPYPPVYPHFDLYPSVPSAWVESVRERPMILSSRATAYPVFDIYPATYPTFRIYPSVSRATGESQMGTMKRTSPPYPCLEIYPPIYPHLDIYPSIMTISSSSPLEGHETKTKTQTLATPATRTLARTKKPHRDLHIEVFPSGIVRTSSGTGIRPELDLQALSIPPRGSHRRIAMTRSPTGPAMSKPIIPPALPSPSRRLPTPPSNGGIRSPNVLEQMAGYVAEVNATSPNRRYPSSKTSTAQRASMIQPLRQMPFPKSADSLRPPDDRLVNNVGLSRASSMGGSGRGTHIKSRVRDSFVTKRVQSYDAFSAQAEPLPSSQRPQPTRKDVSLSDYPFV